MGSRFSAPIQTGPGAHLASCTMGTGGKERPGRDADPSPPSSAVVMKGKSYTSTPPMGRTACTEPVQGCTLPLPYIFIYDVNTFVLNVEIVLNVKDRCKYHEDCSSL